MLKLLLRMMESSGTTDGLRNLIDSTLPHSLKLIMDDPKVFGNGVFALAINVCTTFIHNEPTSLTILQEAKLPQSFLRTISKYESPNNEVLLAAVNAFGAICLNGQGLEMFNAEQPLPHFFDLMSSHDFLRNPLDVDSATGLGSTMDELIRHHPSLKSSVFQCVTKLIKKVIIMGEDMNGPGKASDNSHLIQTRDEQQLETKKPDEDDKPEKTECLLVSFIDLVSRFLEGLLQNQSNIKEFVKEGCPEMLLSYYALPLLPANFSITIASDSLSYLFRMISEVSPLPTVLAIAAQVRESVNLILNNTDTEYQKSRLVDYVDVNKDDTERIQKGNELFRQMIQLHGYIGLLSNICCSSVLQHGKNGASLVSEFIAESEEENIISLLGRVHRTMAWETVLLKKALPPSWYAAKSAASTNSNGFKKTLTSMSEHPLGIYSATSQPETSASQTSPENASNTDKSEIDKVPSLKDPRMVNIKHFRILLTEFPQLIVPILQGLIKVCVSRRAGGTVFKPQTMKLVGYMSNLLRDCIIWPPVQQPSAPDCKYEYLASVYTMTWLLLKDERTQTSLQAPLAVAFERQGNVDLLLDNLKQFWEIAIELHEKNDKATFDRVNSLIDSVLTVLLHISSAKALKDSPYLSTMIQKDKKADDYFDPYEWILSVELKLTPLKEYLTSDKLRFFSKSVCQTFIKIFQQIVKGETGFGSSSNVTSSSRAADPYGSFSTPLMASPFTLLRTPVVAAERNIQALVDMGFERASAEQALVRCNNQVPRAVDYLFSHPTPIFGTTNNNNTTAMQPTEESTSEAQPIDNEQDNTNNNDESSDNHDDDTDEEDDDHPIDDEEDDNDSDNNMEEAMDTFVEFANQYNRRIADIVAEAQGSRDNERSVMDTNGNSENAKKLKTIRLDLCETLPSFLLTLVDEREDLIFDIRDLLVIFSKHDYEGEDYYIPVSVTTPTEESKKATHILGLLLDRIVEVQNDSSKTTLLGSRLRLLALLLREPVMQLSISQLSDRFTFLFDMLDFSKWETLPTWSAAMFLVLEALIAQADEPKKAKLTTPRGRLTSMFSASFSSNEDELNNQNEESNNEDDPMEEDTDTNTVAFEQRSKLLQCCVSLLQKNKLSRDDIYAILRMIVRLTKDHSAALHFVELGGVPLLFIKPRSGLEGLQGQQAFIILILRHIVESKTVLENTMKDIITNWFTNPRPRNMDISSFVRSNAHVALRDPASFVNVTTDICRLARYDEYEINRQIKLKKQDDEKSEQEPVLTKQPSSSQAVVYFLLNEIMTIRTEVTALAAKKDSLTDEEKKEENIKFVYTGFLLQCLVELISSYPSCKYDIFNFCKRQNGQRTTTLDGKHRSFVSMLINDLLPYNHTNPSSEETRKQQGLSSWTASTLVAMSYDASSCNDMSPQHKSELIQVRKYVLEAVVRALKETIASSDPASVKYSKFLAFADLCHRILNARPNVGSSIPRSLGGGLPQANNNNTSKEDKALSNAKIMLDKNFVAVLTSAISDIDINYPHSKTILNAMLRPLEQLTKLAIKTDDDIDAEEGDLDKMDLSEESMHVPNEPVAEGDEAPDLYRNSALGMFDAGSTIDEDEYNSGEYTDMFGSSADEEEE